MKTLISLCAFLALAITCSSQNLGVSDYQKEFGIDMTSFIDKFISPGSTSASPSTYGFYIKKKTNDRFLRIHADGGIDANNFQENNADGQTNDNSSFVDGTLDLRIGLEKRIPLGKRWTFFHGGDFITGVDYFSSRNSSPGVDDFTQSQLSFYGGYGAIAGFQFHISERIFLSTEGGISASYFFNKTENSEGNNGATTDGISTNVSIPNHLFLAIKF